MPSFLPSFTFLMELRGFIKSLYRARLATVTLFQLPVTLRLTTLFHTSYCLPPVSVACYIPLLPAPTSCIYRGLSAIQNKQSPHPFLSGSTPEPDDRRQNQTTALELDDRYQNQTTTV